MKNAIKQLVLSGMLMLTLPLFLNAQMGSPQPGSSLIEETFTGKWKFEAPDAPEGSTEGEIEIKPDVVIMRFDGSVEFPSNWVKFRNDSIIYQTVFDAATVVFSVKIVDKNNMSGKAVWEEGETPFVMTKNLGVRL